MTHAGHGEESAPLSTVATALARGPVPLSQAVKIVDRLCEVLGGMHAAGKAHGGVTADAVRFRHIGGALDVSLDAAQTPPATYTPPEVARGHQATDRSDIYQVGLLFHHLISGEPPFVGGTDDDVLARQVTGQPASLENHPLQDVPVELDRLILSMLAKNPSARPKTVEAIRSQIDNLELDSTVMGMRLSELREAARDLGSATPDIPEEAPTRLQAMPNDSADEPTIPPNRGVARPPIDPGPAVVTPPDDVDPFADTFIRNRSEFDLDSDETQMTLPPERLPSDGMPQVVEHVAAAEPPMASSRRIDSVATTSPSQPLSTAAAVMIGVAVFVVTLAVILWVAG